MKQQTEIRTKCLLLSYTTHKNEDIKINISWAKKYKYKVKHLDTIYNSKTKKKKKKISPYQQNLHPYVLPPFCDELPEDNHSSSKGGGGGDRLKLANFARNAYSSVSTSTKSWPWAAWIVMTVSNIRRMLESSEVEGWEAAVAVGSTNASAVRSPKEEGGGGGGGGALKEDSTLGCLELALI